MATIEEFTDVLDGVVDERSEYVYDQKDDMGNCFYRQGGQPSCLIGHVLDRLGVEYSQEWEGQAASEVVSLLAADGTIEGTDRETGLLAVAVDDAQSAQDEGLTWGTAREIFHLGMEQR